MLRVPHSSPVRPNHLSTYPPQPPSPTPTDNHRPFHLANIYSRSTTLFCMPDQPGLLRWEDNYAVPEEGDGDDLSEKSDEDDDDLEDDEEVSAHPVPLCAIPPYFLPL